MKAFWNSQQPRSSQTAKLSHRAQIPQEMLDNSVTPSEEPLGHVHDVYRHWVWLGLHRQTNS
jgi:hypothetical protein